MMDTLEKHKFARRVKQMHLFPLRFADSGLAKRAHNCCFDAT